MTRKVVPDTMLLLATNGILLNDDIGKLLNKYGVGVYISLHRPEKAGLAVEVAKKYNILLDVNASFATSALNWAGEVDWFVSHEPQKCMYLHDGWGVVLQNGDIVTCCWDAEGVGKIDRKSTRLNSSHSQQSRMPSSA